MPDAKPILGNCGFRIPRIRSTVMHSTLDTSTGPRVRGAWLERPLAESLAAKRERLGTALHELATDLARERRRNADLERENRRLRALLDGGANRAR